MLCLLQDRGGPHLFPYSLWGLLELFVTKVPLWVCILAHCICHLQHVTMWSRGNICCSHHLLFDTLIMIWPLSQESISENNMNFELNQWILSNDLESSCIINGNLILTFPKLIICFIQYVYNYILQTKNKETNSFRWIVNCGYNQGEECQYPKLPEYFTN